MLNFYSWSQICGERGIRTPGPARRDNRFRVCPVRPLRHFSHDKYRKLKNAEANLLHFAENKGLLAPTWPQSHTARDPSNQKLNILIYSMLNMYSWSQNLRRKRDYSLPHGQNHMPLVIPLYHKLNIL